LAGKYFFSLLRAHTAEGLLTNAMLKNLGSKVVSGSATERILPMKHFIQHKDTKNLTLWLCFQKHGFSYKIFCVPGTKAHLQKVIKVCL